MAGVSESNLSYLTCPQCPCCLAIHDYTSSPALCVTSVLHDQWHDDCGLKHFAQNYVQLIITAHSPSIIIIIYYIVPRMLHFTYAALQPYIAGQPLCGSIWLCSEYIWQVAMECTHTRAVMLCIAYYKNEWKWPIIKETYRDCWKSTGDKTWEAHEIGHWESIMWTLI